MFSDDYVGDRAVHRIMDNRLVTFVQQTAMQLYDPDLRKHVSFRFPGHPHGSWRRPGASSRRLPVLQCDRRSDRERSSRLKTV